MRSCLKGLGIRTRAAGSRVAPFALCTAAPPYADKVGCRLWSRRIGSSRSLATRPLSLKAPNELVHEWCTAGAHWNDRSDRRTERGPEGQRSLSPKLIEGWHQEVVRSTRNR
jgi:hypothetical protein